MRRITAEEVLLAYQETGLSPVFANWGDHTNNCGCGLTAVAFRDNRSKDLQLDEVIGMLANDVSTEDVRLLFGEDFSTDYLEGFVHGFDNPQSGVEFAKKWGYDDIYISGCEDGVAARNAVKMKFGGRDESSNN